MDTIITTIEEIDSTLNPITEPDGLEILGNIKDQPVALRRYSRSIFKLQGLIKELRSELGGLVGVCPIRPLQYFITEEEEHPALIWPGTTWEKLESKVLIGAGGAFELKSEGGAVSVALAVANIPGHTHSFSATTNTTGNHNHKSGNHRHRVDNHSHSQPAHYHGATVYVGSGATRQTFSKSYTNSNGGTVNTHSAGGENTGGSAPYTDYQNPTTDTKGNHNHTLSGTTGSVGSGSSFNILNPYRAVNIWRRVS